MRVFKIKRRKDAKKILNDCISSSDKNGVIYKSKIVAKGDKNYEKVTSLLKK